MTRYKYDRLRNKLFRRMGIMPYDDFWEFHDAVFKVLSSLERFSKVTQLFCTGVSKHLGIRFDGEKVESIGLSDDDVVDNNISRGVL